MGSKRRRPRSERRGAGFQHPLERAFAAVLDAHGVAWQYEPHEFVLERSGDGRVREAFCPDFLLPELDLYIECTAMAAGLTRRKRRKVERACALHGVTVEVLFRRDAERLAARWGFQGLGAALR